ncbi:three-Cys-motif partner protein TcmP [Lysinibacillus sp. A4]|uniref:three-Cys-motif partner protein TcmP n=1 Tax=Lysinibacillus sp. A4 TaxID=2976269 RepID=UPI002175A05B|nr:three-Cys-motif partner protein TcmP [Lysinibacillus sp. A4]MCS5501310.1 three-Cys-motif partner protein TcmP [Lysinibacillus sp. A4]
MSWKIKKHTKAKHKILKSYLGAWFPIMAFTNPKIVYIDGFAGPGRYLEGEDGSPIYALKIAREIFEKHYLKLKDKQFVFFFIEANKESFESLKKEINDLKLPSNFSVSIINDEFRNVMVEIFDYLDKNNNKLAPTFAFIDPFGTKGVPFEIVKKIMSYKKCEVFFNHMYSGVMRSKHVSDHTELYGTDKWKEVVDDAPKLTELYANQLQSIANVSYTRSFNVRAKNNAHIFDLVYATNNLVGLKKMKEAMWKADPLGNYQFRDTTNPNQIVLFEEEPDLTPLKQLLLEEFSGKAMEITEIDNFVATETPYLSGHIKQKTLQPMFKAKEIAVIRPNGSKSGFKEGTIITFP